MTVQVDSQPVTDHIMWYNDMCLIYNSISCLEKKTTVRNTCSDMSLHGLILYILLNLLRMKLMLHSASPARYFVLVKSIPCLFVCIHMMRLLYVNNLLHAKECQYVVCLLSIQYMVSLCVYR